MVMFQEDYLQRLIELGEADTEARIDEVRALVAGADAKAAASPAKRRSPEPPPPL
jgi:hypothetical protein